jgi:hypothetical protein
MAAKFRSANTRICELCNEEDEDIEHFLLGYKILQCVQCFSTAFFTVFFHSFFFKGESSSESGFGKLYLYNFSLMVINQLVLLFSFIFSCLFDNKFSMAKQYALRFS